MMLNLAKEKMRTKRILGCSDGPSSFNTEADLEGATAHVQAQRCFVEIVKNDYGLQKGVNEML